MTHTKDTIVFLNNIPLTKVMEQMIHIDRFKERGFRVVYLDLSAYYFPDYKTKYVSSNNEYFVTPSYAVECATKEEILGWVKKESKRAWFYVMYRSFHYLPTDIFLLRAFKKFKTDYIVQLMAPLYTSSDQLMQKKKNVVQFIRGKLTKKFIIKMWRTFFNK